MSQPRESSTLTPAALDAVVQLCNAAGTLLDQAHDLCDDPDTEHLTTALILEARDHVLEAAQYRRRDLEKAP